MNLILQQVPLTADARFAGSTIFFGFDPAAYVSGFMLTPASRAG
jgi:hypothetical protein